MSCPNDIFISYQWDIKTQVKKLHEKLSVHKFKVWRDDSNLSLNNTALSEQLVRGIKSSKIFLCCFTKKYSESKNCNLEFKYASDLGKLIIILAIDKPDLEKLGGIGMYLANSVRINCYEYPNTWADERFDKIEFSISQNLEVSLLYSVNLDSFSLALRPPQQQKKFQRS